MANERFRVFVPDSADLTPFHQLVLEAAPAIGLPPVADFSSLDEDHGLGPGPVNISDRLRWNASFAYVDPVRDLPNFELMPDTLVERVLLDGDHVIGVSARGPDGSHAVRGSRVVLAGGAYGTPLLLQRSGIGDPEDIEAHGIYVQIDLPGVGRNLQDHPALSVDYSGTPKLTKMLDDFVDQGGLPREEGTIGLFSSDRCEGPFDMHLYPIAHRNGPGDWSVLIATGVMAPKSTGRVRIASDDPEAQPHIEHCYLTDPENYDLDALLDGLLLARELGATEPLASLIGKEIGPFVECLSNDQIRAQIPLSSAHDYHPSSTCKMGPSSDPLAVVDSTGAVYGVGDLYIADASIFPSVTWANTNLPTLAAAEKIVAGLLNA
jgi:choline dehydrogenase